MDFLLFAGGVLVGIFIVILISFIVKRIMMYLKLKKECKELGATITPTHPLWIFAGRNGSSNDFYIEIHNKVYSIKLFSTKFQKSVLVLNRKGGYFFRKYLAFIFIVETKDSKVKKFPEYNFKKNFRQEWYIKELIPVALVHPYPYDIMCENSATKLRPIDAGETFSGMMVIKLSDFLRQLRKADYEHSQLDKY